ncbi:acyl-CoA dehydrogenase family protein [Pseudomonas neustonica]|uniref:Acyl-CoA dehydrogenase family protein n=1 Tax=Pseudomonas neustonica TaxID=2487346 RepID=A0ABX9XIH6_9PSED|nr:MULTISPECIES: acyl-CoA dehydrogenase family protein [Pseudomonas]ROZ81509.1 acyl-CoA dehydrogenase family protein [Pseudomonas sp. SSM44]ROZ82963.1 acyl-CoA dehydrogenase family protein [Pseudomonas neustonica]|tara:strand:- start:1441 stop:2583 length:1143 start_codon:yes stop_codon:yes gene_type:complete
MSALVLNEEQQMLKDAAKRFMYESAPVSQLRALRDSEDATGFSRELWQGMVEMGFVGTLIPEALGGSQFGYLGMGQVSEQAGRNLSASPLLSTAVGGVAALLLAGSNDQQHALLPKVAAGELLLSLAVDETPRHNPSQVSTRLESKGDGFVLNGRKQFVIDGHVADKLIVSARSSGADSERDGISLLLVDRTAAGVKVERVSMADSRNAALVTFTDVAVAASDLLGEAGKGFDALELTLDVVNGQLAAELLGLSLEAFERTVAYLQERKQFGVTLSSFQGLQHRCAHLFSELELIKSVVLKALMALDEGDEDASMLVSLAKAKASEVAELATNEAVQMHGGMGMTDEFDIGLFMKRARCVQALFGDFRYHANRFALLRGY